MNDGDFSLNKPGNYTVELFEPNDFLNDKNSPADLAKFGKTYSVKFSGDAETYLWTTKTEPVEGKSYYGHIQETSGKMLRFKVDKLADGNFSTGSAQASTGTPDYEPSTNTRWAIGMAYNAYIRVTGSPEGADGGFPFDVVKLHAKELLKMFDELKSGGSGSGQPTLPVSPTQAETASSQSKATPSLKASWEKTVKAVSYDDPPPSEED